MKHIYQDMSVEIRKLSTSCLTILKFDDIVVWEYLVYGHSLTDVQVLSELKEEVNDVWQEAIEEMINAIA